MSRRTSGPDGPASEGEGRRSRRGRRAGRGRDANDFQAQFGATESTPTPERADHPEQPGRPETPDRSTNPDADALREPRGSDRYVRGRTRLTVRELMAQMNAEADAAATGSRPGTARPTASTPTASTPPPGQRGQRGRRQPAPDDSPTAVHRFDLDATQKIPTVSDDTPDVDLSDRATQERVVAESRAQGTPTSTEPATTSAGQLAPKVLAPKVLADDKTSEAKAGPDVDETQVSADAPTTVTPAAPLEPTPDLAPHLLKRSAPKRHPARGGRKRTLARGATTTGRILVALACVTSLVGTGYVWNKLRDLDNSWNTIDALDSNDANIRNKEAQYGDENYLIVGTDTRGGQNAKVGAGDDTQVEGARSDTVILVNVPANRSRVVAVSFPRDLQVDRPAGCNQWDNDNHSYGDEIPAESGVKLNSIYAFGGPKCLTKTLTAISGLNINHFIAMDFYGFEQVVSKLGGVEVCSTTPLYDYELGYILKRSGKQRLTGKRALNYVRARTIAAEGNGDYGRIKRQQLFMSSLLRSTLSSELLTNPSKLTDVFKTFTRYSLVTGIDTNSLLDLAESMQGLDAGRVTFITIPTAGTADDGSNNELPRTEDIDALFNAIIDDDPLPQEKARRKAPSSHSRSASPSAPTQTTPDTPTKVTATAQNPANVAVRVLNGTGRTGLASEVSDQLTPNGFEVRGVADASESRADSVVRYGVGQEDAAATLAAMIPGATIQLDKTVRSGVEVIIGTDYTGSLNNPPEVGSTLDVTRLPPSTTPSNLPNDLAVTNAGDTTCN